MRPLIEEVMLDDDEIERIIHEEFDRLMDPEEKHVRVEDLDASANAQLRIAVERRLRETYPHLFWGPKEDA
jgi:hypothetical protein